MVFFCDLDKQWIHRFADLLKNHTDSTSAEIKLIEFLMLSNAIDGIVYH